MTVAFSEHRRQQTGSQSSGRRCLQAPSAEKWQGPRFWEGKEGVLPCSLHLSGSHSLTGSVRGNMSKKNSSDLSPERLRQFPERFSVAGGGSPSQLGGESPGGAAPRWRAVKLHLAGTHLTLGCWPKPLRSEAGGVNLPIPPPN